MRFVNIIRNCGGHRCKAFLYSKNVKDSISTFPCFMVLSEYYCAIKGGKINNLAPIYRRMMLR